jgi:hypothetical protein
MTETGASIARASQWNAYVSAHGIKSGHDGRVIDIPRIAREKSCSQFLDQSNQALPLGVYQEYPFRFTRVAT